MSKPATGKLKKIIDVNTIMVISLTIQTFPPEAEGVAIVYATGYETPEGQFVPVEKHQATVSGDKFADMKSIKLKKDDSLFQVLFDLLYGEIDKIDNPVIEPPA